MSKKEQNGHFSVTEYTGPNAAEALIQILNGYRQTDEHDVESVTVVRTVGFQPNPESEDDDDSDI
jgi:hypothetical protein